MIVNTNFLSQYVGDAQANWFVKGIWSNLAKDIYIYMSNKKIKYSFNRIIFFNSNSNCQMEPFLSSSRSPQTIFNAHFILF